MTNIYAGMTVNERLYKSGLMDKFDEAVKEENVDLVISILKEVKFDDLSIEPILNHFGLMRKLKDIDCDSMQRKIY